MSDFNHIDTLTQRLMSSLPSSVQQLHDDAHKNLHSSLQSGLQKMNLVTREEFDIQNAVLIRTREKLDILEKKVKELEKQATLNKNKE